MAKTFTKTEPTKQIIDDQVEKRRRVGEMKLESDLFKLNVASANKNVAFQEGLYQLEPVEHVHFFHTYDSDGKKHLYSQPVLGHFHEIKYKEVSGGRVKIESVSGPLRMKSERDPYTGKMKNIARPVNEMLNDNHTHEIQYISSQEVTARQVNVDAIKLQTEEAQKTAPIPGVI